MKLKGTFIIGIALLFTVIGAQSAAAQSPDVYFLIKKNYSIFSKTYETVALEYVDEVDPEILMQSGLDAMLETLDPYTVLFNEAQNEQAEIISRGNYAGIGIEAGYRDGEVVVIAPMEGAPAEKAGIRAGDIIIAVDGVSTEDLQPEEVNALTSGETGSKVTITIKRFGVTQPLDFTLKRERIEVTNISYSGLIGATEHTGYIRLSQFGNNSAEEIRKALADLMESTELNGLVLDLRDNPGGILQEAVQIIDKFVEPGITVVDIRGRLAEYNQTFSTREPVMFDKPVIVLMNGGSASASEVVAGALQDLDRALIIGKQSFGKGLVQIVKPLPYNNSLKLTISRYYIPSGRSIQSVQYTHQGRNAAINADTSRQEFKTRNGRIVYEGRGIEPDVESMIEEPDILEIALMQQGMYFDYATEYEAENEVFNADELPDEVFVDFQKYLSEENFSYQTDSEKILADLQETLPKNTATEKAITELHDAIAAEKEVVFNEAEQSIRRALFLELISRYKNQSGRIKASLKTDADVATALEYINNQAELAKLLSGE